MTEHGVEIDEKYLQKWINDESITEGDRIVYPDKIMEVVREIKLKLIAEKEE